jgi:flagellin-like hook-associated protein FlgL
MTRIASIPTTRVSDAFIRARLLSQAQFHQLALFRLENAISTGRRIELSSDDPPAALRGSALQTLLERKAQVLTDVRTGQSFLSAADTALSQASSLIAEIRAAALTAVQTVPIETRQNVAEQTTRTLEQLVTIANQQFRGRYLFTGARTSRLPVENLGPHVAFWGDEGLVRSYFDLDELFASNLTAQDVFGVLSRSVEGAVDLDPVLTDSTRLSDLRGGAGIVPGSIVVSNGTASSLIDLSGAATIGDVARLIESNPPSGSTIRAYVGPDGLRISADAGTFSIREVPGGTTAADLGILADTAVTSVMGGDLDPALTATTPLADILGVRAAGRHTAGPANAQFLVEANQNGAAYNGYTITLVAGGVAGFETVAYDTLAQTITVSVESGVSTAQNVVDAVNASAAGADFTARLAPGSNGTGKAAIGSFTTADGAGIDFDESAGLRIVNGGQEYVVTFASAETVEDLLNILRGSGAGVDARINAAGNGIDIRSRLSGQDFAIGENGGTTATDLGVRSFTLTTRLADLNYGRGVETEEGDDFIVRRKDGVDLAIDLDAVSAQAAINPAGANNALVFESLPPGPAGNAYSIEIQDSGPGGGVSVSLVGDTLTFSVDIAAGFTAQEAIDLLAASPLAPQFTARLDDAAEPGNDGSGNVAVAAPTAFSGGRDAPQTVGDVIDLINSHPANVGPIPLVARLAEFGNGIELVDDNVGAPGTLTVLKTNLSLAAYGLGWLDLLADQSGPPQAGALASAAINGAGANDALVVQSLGGGAAGNGYFLEIVDSGLGGGDSVALVGNTLRFSVDIAAGFTAQEAVTLLQGTPPLDTQFAIALDTVADPGNNGSDNLAVTAPIPFTGGRSEQLTGRDVNPQEVQGVFTALLRLREALLADDVEGISRAIEILDEAQADLNFARAELGARRQGLDIATTRLEDEEVELRKNLSDEIDTDLVEAISELSARQVAYEAALRALGSTLQLTLLDFL